MSYEITIKPSLDKKLGKLFKKNRKLYDIILSKMDEILLNHQHYKNLRKPKQHLKRVCVVKSFVLVFQVFESSKTVDFVDFDHHDTIYL